MLELNSGQIRARFTTLGARLVALDFAGADVIMGGGTDSDILAGDWTTGAVAGRIAGRITNSRINIDGTEYPLVPNTGAHQLHGGPDNFSVRHWNVQSTENAVRFSLHSPDGDQGYPGALDVTATYAVNGATLSLDFAARTTKPTTVNLTNHTYWNLSGGARNAFAHEIEILGSHYLPLSAGLLPSGEIRDVTGTRWDFRELRKVSGVYDNCWVLDGPRGTLRHGLTLKDPVSGRTMEVWTTEAGMQMYTAEHWNEGFPGKTGPLQQYAAIAIEPQNFPDAPTHANFPSALLRPDDVYRHRMEWRFSV
ncbi:aldose epimerase family protein [Aestuariivirga sp.]|uniref:aldose epimerase family protein n=1 Tax=Aestuariivirga sp. TaxID=2650926 RepID=UPI0025C70F8D|nr:aldose epimerase family protein [Aestuariivirga sp.]MCA3556205.1 galactose mutarotase [Aestuariivirga sp.]